ncbi:endo-1,4-beta-xylanase [Chitinivibrio alkaliphilus]|uniref:Beta-xylanase n=1 Tax=Chitinivibrio alkaliphilus ACht1 TaxID=1313304 RepID=U7D6A5_9BACT|nr:endo-1,4-beta-xylanase [Chitinivibrio alkaliphilus]ERP32049.1 glycoside hydrolase, GH10 family [Chitinivibrio alkaliphilus ACht1]
MQRRIILYVFHSILACMILPLHGENLIPTGDFERYDPSWEVTHADHVSTDLFSANFQSSEAAASGNYGAKIEISEKQEENWHIQIRVPSWTARKNQLYRFSMDARGPAPIHVSVSYDDWTYKEGFRLNIQEDEFQHFSGNFYSDTSGTDALIINIGLATGEGIYHLDNISLYEIEEIDETNQWYHDAPARIDSIRKEDFSLHLFDKTGSPMRHTDVQIKLQRHEFSFGTAFNLDTIGPYDSWYREKTREYFSEIVTENALKWVDFEPVPGSPDRENMRKYTEYAKKHDIPLRGHVLMWGLQQYGFEDHWSNSLAPEELVDAIRERIIRDVSYYRGKIQEYDVWNEPIHELALFRKTVHLFPDNEWALLDSAFIWAHRADPDARLFLNEYSLLAGGQAENFVDLVTGMRERNVPIHGLGVQGHFGNNSISPEVIRHRLDELSRAGLPIKITEFDMGTRESGLHLCEEEQAEQYSRFIRTVFSHPAVEGMLLWGFWDKKQWVAPIHGSNGAGLYRVDKSAKPVADSIRYLWDTLWTTNKKVRTTAEGTLNFRGFRGTYSLQTELEGIEKSAEIILSSSHKDSLILQKDTPTTTLPDKNQQAPPRVITQKGRLLNFAEKPEELFLFTPRGERKKLSLPAGETQVDLSELARGIYILRLRSSEGTHVQKRLFIP